MLTLCPERRCRPRLATRCLRSPMNWYFPLERPHRCAFQNSNGSSHPDRTTPKLTANLIILGCPVTKIRHCPLPRTGCCNGYDGTSAFPTSVRVHHLVPHYFPVVHDRACRVADRPRSAASQNRSPGLSGAFRILAENFWRGIRPGCRIRNRDGIPI